MRYTVAYERGDAIGRLHMRVYWVQCVFDIANKVCVQCFTPLFFLPLSLPSSHSPLPPSLPPFFPPFSSSLSLRHDLDSWLKVVCELLGVEYKREKVKHYAFVIFM